MTGLNPPAVYHAANQKEHMERLIELQQKVWQLERELSEAKHQNWILQAKLITAEGISEMRLIANNFLQGKRTQ